MAVYSYKKKQEQKPQEQKVQQKPQQEKGVVRTEKENGGITLAQEKKLRKEMERTGVSEAAVCQRFQITGIREMNKETYERALDAFRKTKSIAA